MSKEGKYMKIGPYEIKPEKRPNITNWDIVKISIVAVLIGLALFNIIFILAGVSPLDAYTKLFKFAFGEVGLPLTVHRSTFLLLCSLAFVLPFRAGLWNIGATGQFYLGSIGAFGVMYAFGAKASSSELAATTVISLAIVGSLLAGGAIAGFAGFLKGKWDINEVLATMMLNFIALWFLRYMIQSGGPFMSAGGMGESFSVPASLRAPLIGGYSYTVFIAIGITMLLYFLLAKTTLGYEIKALGANPVAARYSGISSFKITIIVFILGGVIAGFAGYQYFAATPGVYKIPRNFATYGSMAFYGIVIGLIAHGRSFGAIPLSLFFGGITIGGRYIQGVYKMPFGVDQSLLGVMMITIIAFQFFYQYKLVAVKKSKGEG